MYNRSAYFLVVMINAKCTLLPGIRVHNEQQEKNKLVFAASIRRIGNRVRDSNGRPTVRRRRTRTWNG